MNAENSNVMIIDPNDQKAIRVSTFVAFIITSEKLYL